MLTGILSISEVAEQTKVVPQHKNTVGQVKLRKKGLGLEEVSLFNLPTLR